MGIRNDVIMSKGTTVFGMALHLPKSADLALTTVLTIFLGVFALVFEHHPALVVTIITGWLLMDCGIRVRDYGLRALVVLLTAGFLAGTLCVMFLGP